MPKLYDMWTELKIWLEQYPITHPGKLLGSSDVLEKMDELEMEYE